jgi:hypothetical protein
MARSFCSCIAAPDAMVRRAAGAEASARGEGGVAANAE